MMECEKLRENLSNSLLLNFSEKDAPFLEFSAWLSQWNNFIIDYEEYVRAKLLYEHMDVPARKKFCGFDRHYGEAMKRLGDYHGSRSNKVYHGGVDISKNST